jgi:hypothetical protein
MNLPTVGKAAATAAKNLNLVRNNISSNGNLTTIMFLNMRTDPVQKVQLDARLATEEKISRVEISSPLLNSAAKASRRRRFLCRASPHHTDASGCPIGKRASFITPSGSGHPVVVKP